MRYSKSLAATLVASALLPLTGCIGWWGPVDVEWSVRQSAGVSLHKEFGINVGPAMIAIAGAFVGDAAPVDIKHISGVDVGIYKVTSADPCSVRELELTGWERMLRIREGSEDVLVFVKVRGGAIRAMLVVVLEGDELVIAKVRGKIDKLIEEALRHTEGGDFDWENMTGVQID